MTRRSKWARKYLDGFAPIWEDIGERMRRRPLFVLALIISSIIVAFAAITFVNTAQNVNQVSDAFCNGQARKFDAKQMRNCRALLDQLLKNPTPDQLDRIREIARTK